MTSYDEHKAAIRPRLRVWDTVKRCRGSLDPRRGDDDGRVDERERCEHCGGCGFEYGYYIDTPVQDQCPWCMGDGKGIDPEAEADRLLEEAGKAGATIHGWRSLPGELWALVATVSRDEMWTYWNYDVGSIPAASVRARLPINGVLETVECEDCGGGGVRADPGKHWDCEDCNATGTVPVVERVAQQPEPGVGERCACIRELRRVVCSACNGVAEDETGLCPACDGRTMICSDQELEDDERYHHCLVMTMEPVSTSAGVWMCLKGCPVCNGTGTVRGAEDDWQPPESWDAEEWERTPVGNTRNEAQFWNE